MPFSNLKFVIFLCFVVGAVFLASSKKDQVARAKNSTPTDRSREPIIGETKFVKRESIADFSQIQKYVEKQWALKDIGLLEAWEEARSLKSPSHTKKNRLVVAVIDTGIHKKHACFQNQLWTNKREIPNNKKDDDNNGFVDDVYGWNFVDGNGDVQDHHGHGSHVSGIIASNGSGNCKIMGVAPQVQIMTLKYYDPRGENSDNIKNTISAIKYAVAMGADIINYSGGGPGANQDEKTAIAKAADQGIIFVAALGNEGSKIGKRVQYYPASYKLPNIVFLQSHDQKRNRLNSSNYIEETLPGNKQVQTAPGENIISTLPPQFYLQGHLLSSSLTRKLASSIERGLPEVGFEFLVSRTGSTGRALSSFVKKDYYGYMTGTSQATAVATGVVALVRMKYPHLSMDKIVQLVTQSNQLSAYQAITMRPQNVDFSDQPYHTPSQNVETPVSDSFEQIKKIEDILRK